VQEALLKNELRPDLRWHLIGSLQTNKVRSITGSFTLIHSVDRLKLAQEIDKEARRAGLVQDILLQMHIGDEESKSGVDQLEAPALIEKISQEFSSLRLCGLMSLPPLTDDEMQAREQFAQLRLALEKWRSILPEGQREFFRILSMGTSSDYEWAILEGATHVRIGTSIFGAREAKGTV
jgi:pyridoxal phosphate enzyme (YggS family)